MVEFLLLHLRKMLKLLIEKKGKKPFEVLVELKMLIGQSSGFSQEKEMDDLLKIIKMCDYKVVDQLLHTPSKIFIMALLMNSAAYRNSLMNTM